MKLHRFFMLAALVALPLFAIACGDDDDDTGDNETPSASATTGGDSSPTAQASAEPEISGQLIVYSGRSEDLIGPILEQF